MVNNFRGTGVALVTPFNEDLSVDYAALEQLVNHVSSGGVDYLVVMGTTAESPTLNENEKLKILRFVKSKNKKGLPVVFGFGGNNTQYMVDHFKTFDEEVDAFLVVCPYYNRPSQQGLQWHYEALADVAPKPIILYNVPKRTGCNLEVSTVLRLSEHANIIGIKEASGNDVTQAAEIAKGKSDDFLLISGDDDLIHPFMKIGGQGVISVIANALPSYTKALVDHALAGNESAEKLANDLEMILSLIFSEGNPSGVKALLEVLGIGKGRLRLPLVSASTALKDKIELESRNFQ
jgi:4-hydroxy-tetrahydrodipicolinate synthase